MTRHIVEQSSDGTIFADRNGVIRLWNNSAERISAHSIDEAAGKSLDLIVPERFREAHWSGYSQAMATGKTKYTGQALPTRSIRWNTYVRRAYIHDQSGKVLGASAQVRDITARYKEERELKKRLAEAEQQVKALEEKRG